MNKPVTIYALRDPTTDEIRYIGQTIHPDTRLYFHIMESRNTPTQRKSQWINQLMQLDLPPIFCVITVVAADLADDEEVRQILQAKSNGINLLNRRASPIGGVAKQRQQHSKANIIQTAIDRMYHQEIKTMPRTIETTFDHSDLPNWAQNDSDLHERCKSDLSFRVAVFEAETPQRRRQLQQENRRYMEEVRNR